ncbi:MAG: hypothetical protein M3Z27_03375, partial [Actinomycetota bacterium]|nr:hypothetical protein [Actinomycetota bacterium]
MALACGWALPAGAGAAPSPAPSHVLDGASPAIVSLGPMALARDGTGGLVYLKQVGGVAHVFVSRIVAGVFQGPEQVDATLPTASSQPVIAAAGGGLLAVAFINSGSLLAVTRAGAASPYTAPLTLAAGASNPALAMTIFGKAYLAFTASGAGRHNVRAAYFARGSWAIEPSPLDAQPG